MAGRTTLNVSLTPQLSQFVAATVASGRYLSASEVVREGLRLLEELEILRQAGLEKAPGEQAFAEIEARLDQLEKAKNGG